MAGMTWSSTSRFQSAPGISIGHHQPGKPQLTESFINAYDLTATQILGHPACQLSVWGKIVSR